MSSRLGVHVYPGSREGFAEVCAATPAVIAVSGDPQALREAHSVIGKESLTIYRDTSVYDGLPPGVENMTEAAAVIAAELYWPRLREVYDQIPADYYQPVLTLPTDDPNLITSLVTYQERLLELAGRDGYHLAIGGLAAGTPFTWNLWLDLVDPLIKRAADGKHIYCRQAFGGIVLGSSGRLTKDGHMAADDIAALPFREAAYLHQKGITTPLIIVAAGQNGGIQFPDVTEFIEDVQTYDRLCQEHENIWGFCCWTYGQINNLPVNMEGASSKLAEYLSDQGGAQRPAYPKAGDFSAPIKQDRPPVPTNSGRLDSKFVKFSTRDNLNALVEKNEFSATWRLRNNGHEAWHSDFQVIPVESDLSMDKLGFSLDQVTSTPVRPGQEMELTLTLTAPEAAVDPYRIVWQLADSQGRPFGTRFWIRVVVVTKKGKRPQLKPLRVGTGMNINPDAQNSNPMDDDILKGLDWVRFPFKAADKNREVFDSFEEYDPIIEAYRRMGTGSLVILNQQTVGGRLAPWKKDGQSWSAYADRLAKAAGEIAAHYAHLSQKVAFEIWNEGDNPKTPHVSVYIPPKDFALVLRQTTAAIRKESPKSPIILGGLSTGPELASEYVQKVKRALDDSLPVDAVGLHPYGRWPKKRPIPGWGYGDLDKVLTIFRRRLPGIRLWITEIGIVGRRKPLAEEHLPAVASYMEDLYELIAEKHSNQVRAVIWFAWSDRMENAGIVDAGGNPKPVLMKSFTAVRERTIVGLDRPTS